MPPHEQNLSAGADFGLLHLLHFSFPSPIWRVDRPLLGGGPLPEIMPPILAGGGAPREGDGPTVGGDGAVGGSSGEANRFEDEPLIGKGPLRAGGGEPILAGDLGVGAEPSSDSPLSLGSGIFTLGGGPLLIGGTARALATRSSRACSSSAVMFASCGIANFSS